jgi:ornithine lipid ester-linked acyl 2-hydroxylase
MPALEATTPTMGMAKKAMEKISLFLRLIAMAALMAIDKFLVPRKFSQVETTPFIDPRQFEWHEIITSGWATIQSELKAVLSAVETIPSWPEVMDEQGLVDDDKWRTYFFFVYGKRFEKQCSECPDTTRLLQKIPGMKTALFSILAPGTRLAPHRGPYRGVMRYHLPLLVPEHGQCGIRVGDQTTGWEEGVGIMFDDTYEHEAWNDTNETRVVLFLDITRPMKFPFNIINSAIIKIIGWSPTVRQIQKKQYAWDRAIEGQSAH